jgi:hypothetical protein
MVVVPRHRRRVNGGGGRGAGRSRIVLSVNSWYK